MDGIDTGTQFNFEYAPGTTLEQMIGFEMAGQFWSEYLADNVTLNIFVEMTDTLPENVVGGALPGLMANQTFTDYKTQIAADADPLSATDQGVVSGLNRYGRNSYSVLMNDYKAVSGNTEVKMTRANAKALGLTVDDPLTGGLEGLDSYILMSDLSNLTANQDNDNSNDIKWHYGFDSNNVPNKKLDFLSVALHEVGHALGFVSGIDDGDWLTTMNGYRSMGDEYEGSSGNNAKLTNATPVDMLRFSNQIGEWRDEAEISEYAVDMSFGGNPFFSVNGGRSATAYFATGEETNKGGDGNQASHWKKNDANPLGIMDPVLSTGMRREISDLDQTLFDAIGWNLRTVVTDLTTIETEAKEVLVDKINRKKDEMKANPNDQETLDWQEKHQEESAQLLDTNNDVTVTVEWLETYIEAAVDMLNPSYKDKDNNGIDDRGEKLNEMITGSNTYEWGWSGYWWGWSGYWWGWSGYWQNANANNDSQNGFWQHFSWQTIDVSNSSGSTTETSEPDIAYIFDNTNPGNRTRDNNPFNRQQHQNLSKYEQDDSLVSKPQEQNTEYYGLNLGDRDEPTDKEEVRLDPLSGDLIAEPLVVDLVEEELLVIPIK